MSVNNELIQEVLESRNFVITEMESDPDKGITRLHVYHNTHPEDLVYVDLVAAINEGSEEETVEMQFQGPDVYTEDEARQVLQEVMDTLVTVIETGIEQDMSEIFPEDPEDPEDPEGEDNANN